MASTRRKAAAIAIAVIGVAGLSLAAAAQLNITSDSLGAGSIDVGACDTDGIAVDYTVLGANVTEVLLSGVAAACDTDDFSVTLTGTSGTLQTVSGALSLTGTTATIVLAAAPVVPVASVTGVSIVIH